MKKERRQSLPSRYCRQHDRGKDKGRMTHRRGGEAPHARRKKLNGGNAKKQSLTGGERLTIKTRKWSGATWLKKMRTAEQHRENRPLRLEGSASRGTFCTSTHMAPRKTTSLIDCERLEKSTESVDSTKGKSKVLTISQAVKRRQKKPTQEKARRLNTNKNMLRT